MGRVRAGGGADERARARGGTGGEERGGSMRETRTWEEGAVAAFSFCLDVRPPPSACGSVCVWGGGDVRRRCR